MAHGPRRWTEVTRSQFPHEAEGLAIIRALLPDAEPFRAWSNFEFRDRHGKWHEVDLLVLGQRRLHLVELKYYSGTLRGDDHTWLRDGHRAEDSPLKLARRKAQRVASKLHDELAAWAREKDTKIPDRAIPYVQECVFLHHPGLRCLLPPGSRIDLFGPDDRQEHTAKSLRALSGELGRQGHRAGADTVADLLREEGFSLQGNAKTIEGNQVPDRDAQFRYLNEQVREHRDSGEPVISVDTKKKELVGNYRNGGREWRPAGEPVHVKDHDFPDLELGKAIPYGIYDLAADAGWVNVGTFSGLRDLR